MPERTFHPHDRMQYQNRAFWHGVSWLLIAAFPCQPALRYLDEHRQGGNGFEATPLHALGQVLQSLHLPTHLYYVEKVESDPSMEAKRSFGFQTPVSRCPYLDIFL